MNNKFEDVIGKLSIKFNFLNKKNQGTEEKQAVKIGNNSSNNNVNIYSNININKYEKPYVFIEGIISGNGYKLSFNPIIIYNASDDKTICIDRIKILDLDIRFKEYFIYPGKKSSHNGGDLNYPVSEKPEKLYMYFHVIGGQNYCYIQEIIMEKRVDGKYNPKLCGASKVKKI